MVRAAARFATRHRNSPRPFARRAGVHRRTPPFGSLLHIRSESRKHGGTDHRFSATCTCSRRVSIPIKCRPRLSATSPAVAVPQKDREPCLGGSLADRVPILPSLASSEYIAFRYPDDLTGAGFLLRPRVLADAPAERPSFLILPFQAADA
jgi:hypothetical protein